jgi:hypothetical protein
MNTLKEHHENVAALVNDVKLMNKDSKALDVISAFRSLRWAVLELENAIMSEIFPTSKENN